MKFAPREEKKVEITLPNPGRFDIYTVNTTVNSTIEETGRSFVNTYTDEFSVCDVVADEDGNPR